MSGIDVDADVRNVWLPKHSSVFADELIDELDDTQQRRLLETIGRLSISEWNQWMHENSRHISKYFYAGRFERVRLLSTPTGDIDFLLIHYTSLQIELARTRIHREFYPLRFDEPNQSHPESEWEIVLAVHLSMTHVPLLYLWPFEYRPDGLDRYPFRRE